LTTSSPLAGQASIRKALIAAVERSGKLDHLIAELERRKSRTARPPSRRQLLVVVRYMH
jgi:hypothetical protein